MPKLKMVAVLCAAAALASCDAVDAAAMCLGRAVVSDEELAEADEVAMQGGVAAVTVHEDGEGFALRAEGPSTIFLNRHGGTFAAGQSDSAKDITSILDEGCAAVPGYAGSDDDWDSVMTCVRDRFSDYDVQIVDDEPAAGDYVEAVIGGRPRDLGLPKAVAGIAPMDTNRCTVLPKAIVFVFAANLPDSTHLVCEVAAQEIAHAYGLDHQYLCEDPMSYLRGCGQKRFQNVDAACGEYDARDCMCGRDGQNSAQILKDVLGEKDGVTLGAPTKDSAPPEVSVVEPADGATLPGGAYVEIVASAEDDVSVSKVELVWDETGDVLPCPLRGDAASCSRIGDTYAWRLKVGTGERTFHVVAEDAFGARSSTDPVRVVLQGGGEMASSL